MSSDRQTKIQKLSRLNRRRAATKQFIDTLTQAQGRRVEASDIISAEESDDLLETFQLGYRLALSKDAISYRKFFSQEMRRQVFELTTCLAQGMSDETAYFLTRLGGDAGAVKVNMSALLSHSEAVIYFDGDSISAISFDGSQGLLIDHNSDDLIQTYEVTVWGDRWPLLTLSCEFK